MCFVCFVTYRIVTMFAIRKPLCIMLVTLGLLRIYRQLEAVIDLDQQKMSDLLRRTSHDNLILTTKEFNHLQEITGILEPFAAATDITQSEEIVTISCVIPSVVLLRRVLVETLQSVIHSKAMVEALLHDLDERFYSLLVRLQITSLTRGQTGKTLAFDSNIFMMATALDPKYGFRWLVDHPGSTETKDAVRHNVTGKSMDIYLS